VVLDWLYQNHANTGPRCAISELKERRKAARPSPTNAATQDAAPAVRVARRACFLCAKCAPPPEKSAARLPTTKKSRALGKHAQRRRISRAGRACAPVAARGAFRFEHKRQREAGAFTFTQRARRKERRWRGGGAALLLEGGAERRRVPGYPSGTRARPSSSAERRMHIAERRSTKHAPGFATREADRGRQVMRLEHDR
jgi:hypothetical protein